MKSGLIFICIFFYATILFGSNSDSTLYVINKKNNTKIELTQGKSYIFKLKDGRKIESVFFIIDENRIKLNNQQIVELEEVESISNEYGQTSKMAFLASGMFLLLTASIIGIVLFLRYLSIKAQNSGSPPNSGEWVLAFLMPFIFTSFSTIFSFFAGIIFAMMNVKYSSKKYNFKIK